jgi:hypothetical protein
MTNMKRTSFAVAGIIAVTLVGFVVLFFWRTDTIPEPAEITNDFADSRSVDAPVGTGDMPSLVEVSPSPSSSHNEYTSAELTVEDLIQGLMRAADAQDGAALRELRAALMSRNAPEVVPLAIEQLELELADSTVTSRDRRLIRTSNLAYIICAFDAATVFARLRRNWSSPEIAGARMSRWEETDRLPVSLLANRALDDVDRLNALAIGYAVVHDLQTYSYTMANSVFAYLVSSYSDGVSDGEVPDPWLSEFVLEIGKRQSQLNPAAWAVVVPALETIRRNHSFSARLRRQVAPFLVEAPSGFWELLDVVRVAESLEVAATALRKYLERYELSTDELEMLLSLYNERFGTTHFDYHRFMTELQPGWAPNVRLDTWRSFAGGLLQLARTTNEDALTRGSLGMLYEMARFWPVNHTGASSTPMFSGGGEETLTALRVLYERTSESEYIARSPSTDFPSNQVLVLAWKADAPIRDVLSVVNEICAGRAELTKGEFIAVINGLDDIKFSLSLSEGALVAQIIDTCFAKYRLELTEKRPVTPLHTEAVYSRQFGQVLRAVGFPSLSGTCRNALVEMARIVKQDSPGWLEREWRHVSPTAIEHIRAGAQAILSNYEAG